MTKKTEKRILLDAIEFWKGFLDGVNWSLANSSETAKDRIIDVEVLIDEYRIRLRQTTTRRRKK